MRKFFTVFGLLFTSLVLISCEGTLGNGGSLTQLPTPSLKEITNNYVYWDEIPNASSYIIKINSYQEDVGNQLKYSISAIMDSRIDANVPTELHITVKAKGNQIMYSDSNWSNELVYTYTKVSNSTDSDKTVLMWPTNIKMEDGILSWDEVPNALGYELKIEGDLAIYSSARALYDVSSLFTDSRTFKAQIRSIASPNSNYTNSDWTVLTTFSYVKTNSKVQIGFNDEYQSNGLGRTIDLINTDNFKPKSGVGYIFDEEALFKRTVLKELMREQKPTYECDTNFDSFYEKWKFDIGTKVAKNLLKIDGTNFMPGTADFNIEIKAGYEPVRKDETKEIWIKMHHNIVGNSLELIGHASDYDYYASILSDNFKTAARKVVDTKTAEEFINVWGTHVIMAAYYGAAFEATYHNYTHASETKDNWYANVEAAVKAHLFFSDVDTFSNIDLKVDTDSNSSVSDIDFKAYVVGGNGVPLANDLAGFQKAYERWASTLNESNYVLIDFPENSLYCIWDYLDDTYATQKAILNNYFISKSQDKLNSICSKINSIYNSDSIDYLDNLKSDDDTHKILYQPSTKTLIIDLSKYQESDNLENLLNYYRYSNGVFTIYPMEKNGREINNIHVKGSYKKLSNDDGHQIDSTIKGFCIELSDNWKNYDFKPTIILEDSGFELSDSKPLITSPVDLSIEYKGNNLLISSSNDMISMITAPNITFKANDNKFKLTLKPNKVTNSLNGSTAIDVTGTVTIDGGTLIIEGMNGNDGVNENNKRNGANGSSGINAQNVFIKNNADVTIIAGNGGKGGEGYKGSTGSEGASKGWAWETVGNGGTGGTGGDGGTGGNGGSAIFGNLEVESGKVTLSGGDGGKGGKGGKGGQGGQGGWNSIIGSTPGTGGKGGTGGNGGQGGNGGDAVSGTFVSYTNNIDLIAGTQGDGGDRGSYGDAGFGGNRVGANSGDAGSSGSIGEYGKPGTPGKSGIEHL